ncbi:rRNA pseudouridine synthase [Pseudomonas subflava]|uniref:rRNA pseudouridine synthase n=1 Tax=Pseudomonas subflava TaxID=2952933 RepID=UPI00207AB697|nr:rRNA pseudouridine synthase [Pseudomonas subflava]
MPEAERLSKRLIQQIACSRREAELYIEGGWVTVDGRVVEEPQHPVTSEQIALLPGAKAETQPPITLLLHKPAGLGCGLGANSTQQLLSHTHRWTEDPSGIRPLNRHLRRLELLTPLETDASGLLVFSQSHAVQRLFKEKGAELEQEYLVEVAGQLDHKGLKRLAFGLSYKGVTLPPCKVSWQSETRLRFAIKAVQPGQLRFMCESVGLQVVGMRRLRFGRTGLAKLPVGQWRYLGLNEKF